MILEILGAIGPKREGSKWGKRGEGEGREGGRRPLSLKEKSEIGSAEAKGEGHLGGGTLKPGLLLPSPPEAGIRVRLSIIIGLLGFGV